MSGTVRYQRPPTWTQEEAEPRWRRIKVLPNRHPRRTPFCPPAFSIRGTVNGAWRKYGVLRTVSVWVTGRGGTAGLQGEAPPQAKDI